MKIILLLVAIFPFVTFGQTITMPAGGGSGSTSACAGTFVDHAGAATNYANNQNSTFTICSSTPGQALQLFFTAFSTEAGSDVLTIYDGNSTAAPVIGTFSGGVSPGQITSTNPGGCLTFRFVSDGSIRDVGWSATVSCVPQPVIMSTTGITTCSTTLLDPGGNGNYANGTNITQTFCPATPGQAIQVFFNTFNTEAGLDVVTVYDGNSTAAPVMGTFSGTTIPGTLIASTTNPTGCITIRFVTDGSVTNPGFSATITCTTPALPSFTMSNSSVSACSGTFLDPGGTGTYANSTTTTFTICPNTAGYRSSVSFSSFATEAGLDILTIYDGNSTAAPVLGTFSGATLPGTITASITNPTGCLTFRFVTDGSVTLAGWVADISCVLSCQTITANLVSTNPVAVANIIRACQGQSINFVGSGTFSTTSVGATYLWKMGNGVQIAGQNINYTYPTPGSYLVNLEITDPGGCKSNNFFNVNVQISTTPTITTNAAPDPICTTQSSTFTGSVTPTPFVVNCTPPVSGVTFLPDGSGASYTSSVTTNCYQAGATVTAATDIASICLNMEHSFLGDLSIRLICPNGSSIILKAYPGGGGTYLGAPIDDLTSGPGTGANYCFTPSATTLLVAGTTVTAGSPAGASITPGNYLSVDPFANLIGCPLSGNWSIEVTDNLFADDGYIFNWDLNFAAGITAAASYTPTIASQGWVPAATLTNVNATTATVVPLSQGSPCFTYSVTDNFGCTYTASECILVNCGSSLPVDFLEFNANRVEERKVALNWKTQSEINNDYFVIERKTENSQYSEILTKNSVENSIYTTNYDLFDENAPLENLYYRLSQVDLDGNREVLDEKFVEIQLANKLIAYPNPSTNELEIRSDYIFAIQDVEIVDISGKSVLDKIEMNQLNSSTLKLYTGELIQGVYYVKIKNDLVYFLKL